MNCWQVAVVMVFSYHCGDIYMLYTVHFGDCTILWGWVSLVARASDSQSEIVGLNPACALKLFIALVLSVDRDVTGGPVGRD